MARNRRKTTIYRGYPIVEEEDGTMKWMRAFTPINCTSIEEAEIQIDKIIGYK